MAAHTKSSPTRRPGREDSLNTTAMRRILASSFIGSAIEFYDFVLYATAASLVFNKVFFANVPPAVGLFASFGTLAVGYAARPLGGAIFGHFGDRLGRKGCLIVSMVMMGLGTTAIGLLPGTAQIGLTAPVLLVALRLVQGIAVGGEWGGAMLVALEHSPAKRRGFAASFANMGGPAGAVMATLMVSAVSLMPKAQFLVWGWRVPFLLSLALVGVGLVIRLGHLLRRGPRRQPDRRAQRQGHRRHTDHRGYLVCGPAGDAARMTIRTIDADISTSIVRIVIRGVPGVRGGHRLA
jgi:MHS family shikimate/dehydroshikimate transporter-like MFS transporter